jgi:hypothetical protein
VGLEPGFGEPCGQCHIEAMVVPRQLTLGIGNHMDSSGNEVALHQPMRLENFVNP